MPRGHYDRSKMKKAKELESVRYGYVPPGLKKERDEFIQKELSKNPSLSFESCHSMLKKNNMAGIGIKLFSKMKKSYIKSTMVRPQEKIETKRVMMPNDCEKRTLDIDLSGGVQYTSIRFMKGAVILAELPMVRA